MGIRRNVGGKDQLFRFALGIVLLPVGYFLLSGILAIVAYVVAAIALLTAIFQYCPLNAMLGIDTKEGAAQSAEPARLTPESRDREPVRPGPAEEPGPAEGVGRPEPQGPEPRHPEGGGPQQP